MFSSLFEKVPPPGDRPSKGLVSATPDGRVMGLRLAPGQAIPPHSSPASVLMIVVEGEGRIQIGEEIRHVTHGDLALCPPQVLHGLEAGATSGLSVLAVVTPQKTS